MKRNTSFGTMETLVEREGKIISELLVFEKEGRSHAHEEWEICYVVSGEGLIVVGDERVSVTKGSVCKIPPHTPHWMIPQPHFEILLVYAQTP